MTIHKTITNIRKTKVHIIDSVQFYTNGTSFYSYDNMANDQHYIANIGYRDRNSSVYISFYGGCCCIIPSRRCLDAQPTLVDFSSLIKANAIWDVNFKILIWCYLRFSNWAQLCLYKSQEWFFDMSTQWNSTLKYHIFVLKLVQYNAINTANRYLP